MRQFKKIYKGFIAALLLALVVSVACSSETIVNPMREATPDEILAELGISFDLPEDVTEVGYSIFDMGDAGKIAQATFTRGGISCVYRVMSASEYADISGMYYAWTSEASAELLWCKADLKWIEGGAGICGWYDAAPGLLYSVSVNTGAAEDLLFTLARDLYTPAQTDTDGDSVLGALEAIVNWQAGTAGSSLKLTLAAVSAADFVEDAYVPEGGMEDAVLQAISLLNEEAQSYLREHFPFVDETARLVVSGDIRPEELEVSGASPAHDAYDADKYEAFSSAVAAWMMVQ